MKRLITYIIITIVLFTQGAGATRAQEAIADQSAALKTSAKTQKFDYRVQNLSNFLGQFDSPLTEYSADFVLYADKNGLDYRLVPAISGVESTFGKQIPFNSYNAYGWANGDYSFGSWEESINVVSTTLKNEYVDKGAVSIDSIARKYAPPSSSWGGKVKYFVSKIDSLPLSFDLPS